MMDTQTNKGDQITINLQSKNIKLNADQYVFEIPRNSATKTCQSVCLSNDLYFTLLYSEMRCRTEVTQIKT